MRNFNLKYLYVILAVFLVSLNSCKDNTVTPVTYGTISGIVLKTDGKTVISGALITTNPGTQSVLSGESGEFTLSNVPIGDYTVSAAKSDYEKNTVSISVTTANVAQVTLILNYSASNRPGIAVKPNPSDKSIDQPISLKLSWRPSEESRFDTLKYSLYLYNSESITPKLVASEITDTAYTVSGLQYGTTYFWQVVSLGTDTAATYGNVWSFSTRAFPDNPFVFARKIEGNYQVFSSDSTLTNTVQLTFDNHRNWWPRFNARKNKIAFTSDKMIEPQIYTMNTDGSNLMQITSLGVSGYGNFGTGFCWSADGARLIFSHNDKLYMINSDGSNLTLLATAPVGRNFRECDSSPKGDKIVALTVGPNNYDSEIYLMDSNGSNMTLLVDNSPGVTASPSFSIDGKKIIYTHDVSGYEDDDGRVLDSRIFGIDIDTKNIEELSLYKTKGTNDLNPRFSSSGAYIIFENGSNTFNSSKDIWIMNADIVNSNNSGNNRRRLIENGVMPDWK